MKYKGTLYGKVGGKYFPLVQTSDDVDKIESSLTEKTAQLTAALEAVEKLREAGLRMSQASASPDPQDWSDALDNLDAALAATEPKP